MSPKQETLLSLMQKNNKRLGEIMATYSHIYYLDDMKTCTILAMEAHELVDANLDVARQMAKTIKKEA